MKKSVIKKAGKLLSLSLLTSVLFFSCGTFEDFADFLDNIDFTEGLSEEQSEKKEVVTAIDSWIKAAEDFTPKDEYEIGRAVAASILNQYSVDKTVPAATKYLNNICKTITSNSAKPYLYKGYCVAVLDSDEINAMATPGGHIFVTRGLLSCCESEDALAAVLAHEISHIQLGHSIQAIKANRFTTAGVDTLKAIKAIDEEENGRDKKKPSFIDIPGLEFSEFDYLQEKEIADELWNFSQNIATTIINSGFSQEQEFEADGNALELMRDAGYDPSAMIDMLKVIEQKGNASKGGWNETHPAASDRIINVKISNKIVKSYGFDKSARSDRFKFNTRELK